MSQVKVVAVRPVAVLKRANLKGPIWLGETLCAPRGQARAQVPQRRHRCSYNRSSGPAPIDSGLWHHRQRSGQGRGPTGRFGVHNNFSFSVTSFSKNQAGAKELIAYLMAEKQLDEWLAAGKTFEVGPTLRFADHPAFDKDRKLLAMRDVLKNVTAMWWGWPRPPSAASAEAMVRYTIVDMFAKACSGEYKPAESVKWAESELRRIYKG